MDVSLDLIFLSQREAVAEAAEEVAVVAASAEVEVGVDLVVIEEAAEAEVEDSEEDVEVVSVVVEVAALAATEDVEDHQDHNSVKAKDKCYERHHEFMQA